MDAQGAQTYPEPSNDHVLHATVQALIHSGLAVPRIIMQDDFSWAFPVHLALQHPGAQGMYSQLLAESTLR